MQTKPKSNNSGCFLAFFFLLIIAAAALGGGYWWYNNAVNSAYGSSETKVDITVEEGKGLLDIAPELESKGLLSSQLALRVYLRLQNPSINLLPGKYQLTAGQTMPQLIDRLNAGPKIVSVRVTITEGLRYDEVVSLFKKAYKNVPDAKFDASEYEDIIKSPQKYTFSTKVETFLDLHKPVEKNLEGFLFPDTYVIGTDANALEVMNLQIGTLIRRLEEANLDPTKHGRLKNFYQVLTLASILYREAGPVSQMPIVADIFLKRIESNQALYADSTYLYPLKNWKYPLTNTELTTNYSNKYNTYLYPGLTPTPISNPGIAAIKAALKPQKNPYYYFITGTDGKNYYAKTLTEHQVNINNHL
jgi:UPF0755 protein